MTANIDRDALRGLADAATPGPWEVPHSCNIYLDIVTAPESLLDAPVCEVRSPEQNAKFIAAARQAIPELLDEIDKAETKIQAVRDVLDYPPTMTINQQITYPDGEAITRRIREALDP